MSNTEYRFVIISAPMENLTEIAEKCVEKRFAACAQALPGIMSFYWWNDKVEKANEGLVFFKTLASGVEALSDYVRSIHPYEVPEFISLPIDSGLPAYLEWIAEETGKDGA
ncbi:MAG: divalent-cation tolerance protein CutA [Spirochaetia bacterium]